MAARNRPRANLVKEDLADELQLWHSIVEKIRRCGSIHKQYEDVATSIPLAEDKLLENDDPLSSLPQLESLSALHRQGLKLADEELKLLIDEPDALISNLETLISVRAAFETDIPASTNSSRSGTERERGSNTATNGGAGTTAGGGNPSVVITTGPKGSMRNLKRRLDTDAATVSAVESPAMTPEPMSASTGRFTGKAGSRSGSVGLGASKSDVVSEGLDWSKATHTEKINLLKVGTQVLMRQKKSDGEGILGYITSVSGDGKFRRYEVQDPEPDETGQQPAPTKATLPLLEAIPPPAASSTLPDLPKGKQVIALYPDTSTFYKAEVVGKRGEYVRLRFEGEDEKDKELEVERRFVLDAPVK